MNAALRESAAALSDRPFDLLLALEARLRGARQDVSFGAAQAWIGLAFRLRERWFVVPREDVREVIPCPRLARVPGAKPFLLGVANVRGSLLPVTDLAQLVGLPRAPEMREQRVLVFNSERVPAGVLVDEVAGYRAFAPADQHHELAREAPEFEPYLLGAFAREGRQWLAFSLRKLTAAAAFTAAGA